MLLTQRKILLIDYSPICIHLRQLTPLGQSVSIFNLQYYHQNQHDMILHCMGKKPKVRKNCFFFQEKLVMTIVYSRCSKSIENELYISDPISTKSLS